MTASTSNSSPDLGFGFAPRTDLPPASTCPAARDLLAAYWRYRAKGHRPCMAWYLAGIVASMPPAPPMA